MRMARTGAPRRFGLGGGVAAAVLPAPEGAPPLRHHAPRAASRAPDESRCAAAAGLRAVSSASSISTTNGGFRPAAFLPVLSNALLDNLDRNRLGVLIGKDRHLLVRSGVVRLH